MKYSRAANLYALALRTVGEIAPGETIGDETAGEDIAKEAMAGGETAAVLETTDTRAEPSLRPDSFIWLQKPCGECC